MTDEIIITGISNPEPVVTIQSPVDINNEPIDIPFENIRTVTGDKNSYEIVHGQGIKEVGGIINVPCSVVTTKRVEGVVTIDLPFTNVLDWHVTAMNVSDAPSTLNGEGAFTALTNSGDLKVYAHANANKSVTIPVKWMAKGY